MLEASPLAPAPPKNLDEAYRLILELWHEVRSLRQQNEVLLKENALLREENAALKAENTQLKSRVSHLEERLRVNSSNSSKPPSSDPPGTPPKRRARGGGTRGGQHGHDGHGRDLALQVDQVVPCRPPARCECGCLVLLEAQPVARHQVVELPPPRAEVTEYQILAGYCGHCGARYVGALPEGVTRELLGPRLQALVAKGAGIYRLSKRLIQRFLAELLGVEIALGTISATEKRVSAALASTYQALQDFVRAQPVVHVDETGSPQGNADGRNPDDRRGWLWVAGTPQVVVFRHSLYRNADTAKALLGDDFEGLIVSDRWSAYAWVDRWRRQICWAHLIRDFTRMAERKGAAGRIGRGLLAESKQLFAWWDSLEAGKLARSTFQTYVSPLRQRVNDLLAEAAAWTDATGTARGKTAGTCRDLLDLEPCLWRFVTKSGVPPTNNRAENALRKPVIYRRISQGTESEAGSTYIARLMSVVSTCALQGRRVFDFLTEAILCYRKGQPAPSLLPPTDSLSPVQATF